MFIFIKVFKFGDSVAIMQNPLDEVARYGLYEPF